MLTESVPTDPSTGLFLSRRFSNCPHPTASQVLPDSFGVLSAENKELLFGEQLTLFGMQVCSASAAGILVGGSWSEHQWGRRQPTMRGSSEYWATATSQEGYASRARGRVEEG